MARRQRGGRQQWSDEAASRLGPQAYLRAVVIGGAKGLAKGLGLSALVVLPGLVLLGSGQIIPAIVWMFVGSFAVMASSYRKPWRLMWLTSLLPPLAAIASYAVQLAFYKGGTTGNTLGIPFPLLALAAAATGVVVGALRGRTHRLFRQGNAIMAQRTVGYLVIWGVAYGATQLLAALGRQELSQGGLVAGAFSSAMLTVVCIILLLRRQTALRHGTLAAGAIVFFLVAGGAILAGSPVEASSHNAPLVWTPGNAPPGCQHLTSSAAIAYCALGQQGSVEKAATVGAMGAGAMLLVSVLISIANSIGISIAEALRAAGHTVSDAIGEEIGDEIGFGPGQIDTPGLLDKLESVAEDIKARGAETIERARHSMADLRANLGANLGHDVLHRARESMTRFDPRGIAERLIARRDAMKRFEPAPIPKPPLEEIARVAPKPPRLVDPHDGAPLEFDGETGLYQNPYDERWLSQQDAERLVEQLRREKAAAERDRAREVADFERESKRVARTLKERGQAEDAELMRELAERQQAREDLVRIEKAALVTDDADILLRSGADRIFTADGELDIEYINKLKRTLRARLGRDVAAPDHTLGTDPSQWISEFASQTAEDVSNSFVVRLGAGVLTGGTSEIAFQSYKVGAAMKTLAEQAADKGQDLGRLEALGHGLVALARENLPVATIQAIQRMQKGENVSWTELGVSVVGDVFATFGTIGDMRNVAGGLSRSADTLSDGLRHGFSRQKMGELLQNATYTPSNGIIDAFARTTLDDATYRAAKSALKTKMASVQAQVGDSLERLGMRGGDGLGDARLDPKAAKAHFEATTLGREADEALAVVSKNPSDELKVMKASFERGRLEGQRKVSGLQSAIDDLDAAKRGGSDAKTIRLKEVEVREQVLRVQADKHAMHQLNKLPRDPVTGESATIHTFNRGMQDIYDQADLGARRRLAAEYGVSPDDIQAVTITNVKGGSHIEVDPKAPPRDHYGLASKRVDDGSVVNPHGERVPSHGPVRQVETPVHGEKSGFDRDLTMRVRTFDEAGNVIWRDIPSNTMGRVYNEELFKAAKGLDDGPKSAGRGFENTHLTAKDHLMDPMDIDDVDIFAKRLDQATTDRLHPEAYGTGQADLDTATKDAFRGRDLTDAGAVGKTMEFKVHHWMQESESLLAAARQTDDFMEQADLLAQAAAHQEEGMRQLTKQYGNMVITRTDKMMELSNAPRASIPKSLAERVNVLKAVQDQRITAPEAEAVLRKMGTSTEQVAHQVSSYVEALQTLRTTSPRLPSMPSIVVRGYADDFTQVEGDEPR